MNMIICLLIFPLYMYPDRNISHYSYRKSSFMIDDLHLLRYRAIFEETRGKKGREKKDIFKDETDTRQGHGQFVIFILF